MAEKGKKVPLQSIGVQGADGDMGMAPSRGSGQKTLPPGRKGRWEGMSGIGSVGGVGRSQTRAGKEVSGRGRSIVLEGTEVGVGGGLGNCN